MRASIRAGVVVALCALGLLAAASSADAAPLALAPAPGPAPLLRLVGLLLCGPLVALLGAALAVAGLLWLVLYGRRRVGGVSS